MRSRVLALACSTLWAAASLSATTDDERLCERVLALANDDALDGAFVAAVPAADVDEALVEQWREEGYANVAGAYDVLRGDGTSLRLLSLDGGGTCHSYDLAFADGTKVSFDPLVEDDEGFGLDVVPLRLDGTSLALAYHGDRWSFAPLALVRLEPGASVPLCRFAATGAVHRVRVDSGPDDPVCAAVRDGGVREVEWNEVADEAAQPELPLPFHQVDRAELDWFGDGAPLTTWRFAYQSGAGCGMDYRFLALAAAAPGSRAIDTSSAAGAALFPTVEGERVPIGAWRLDGVFVRDGRTWFAGQPQWGTTKRGDYAVYRVDRDGVNVQCRYRHLPQFRIETRAF